MISYACEEHTRELGTVYLFEQAHPLGAACGMPNSHGSFAGNRCECKDTLGHDELFEEWMSTKVEELLRHLEGDPFPPEQVRG
jgi:hypothetical protein